MDSAQEKVDFTDCDTDTHSIYADKWSVSRISKLIENFQR